MRLVMHRMDSDALWPLFPYWWTIVAHMDVYSYAHSFDARCIPRPVTCFYPRDMCGRARGGMPPAQKKWRK